MTKQERQIAELINRYDKQSEMNDLITQDEACALMGWKKKTMQNKISDRTIPMECFTFSKYSRNRLFFKSKLLNLV